MNAIPDPKPTNVAFTFYLLQLTFSKCDGNELCYLHGNGQHDYANCRFVATEESVHLAR